MARIRTSLVLVLWLTPWTSLVQCFTIITSPTRRLSPRWISNIKTKWVKIAFCFQCFAQAEQCCHACFFSGWQKKRRDGVGGILEVGGGGVLTCTCLQSLRIHCTIHLLCLFCHGWGQSDQTPIRFLILPTPPHPPALCICTLLTHPPPNTSFFLYVTCWLKERQGNSWASPNGEMSGRDPHQNHVVMEMQESPEITHRRSDTVHAVRLSCTRR